MVGLLVNRNQRLDRPDYGCVGTQVMNKQTNRRSLLDSALTIQEFCELVDEHVCCEHHQQDSHQSLDPSLEIIVEAAIGIEPIRAYIHQAAGRERLYAATPKVIQTSSSTHTSN